MSVNGVQIDCQRCPTSIKTLRTHVVLGSGSGSNHLMLVGEAPGKEEDKTGHPFVGQAGMVLNTLLRGSQISRSDTYITNIVKCRPQYGNRNRMPTTSEISACSPYLREEILRIQPWIICPMGNSALQFFRPQTSITQEKGKPSCWENTNIVVFPLYHPSVAIYNREKYAILQEDMNIVAIKLKALGIKHMR